MRTLLSFLLFALWDGEVLLAGAVGDSRDGGAIYAAAVVLPAKEGPALTLPSETSWSNSPHSQLSSAWLLSS